MIVYTATKRTFMEDAEQDTLVDQICQEFQTKMGRPNIAEVRAWENSLGYMYKVLNDHAIPSDAGVAVEFRLPGTSRRVDFIISGRNRDNLYSAVVIELKQWERAQSVAGVDGIIETYMGGGMQKTTHPSYQAWSYATFFKDYNVEVQERPIQIFPCAYLHNYEKKEPDDLLSQQYKVYIDQAPPFMKRDIGALRDFIRRYIHCGDQREALYIMDRSEIRPSKSLQDLLASMMAGNQEFILIDSQKIVYETAIAMAYESKMQNSKKVLIIEGGPGTGKSVIAINLLVSLIKRDMTVQYVTKNSAPRNVYEAKLTGSYKKSRISNLFQTSGAYVDAPLNHLDILVIDEAHRLTDRSGMFRNLGENQIKELIHAGRIAIFFIDESQRVTTNDCGSIEQIEYFARIEGAEIVRMQLESQFRCDGSDGYIAWLDDVLDIRKTANDINSLNTFDFQVIDDPNEVRDLIYQRNSERNKARLLAGYCWNWNKADRNNPSLPDIAIQEHDFYMSWNLENTTTWAIDPESVSQVGCIHTSQGLEFDYIGVIVGPDMRYENKMIVTDFTKRAKTDQSLKGIVALSQRDRKEAEAVADEIIKNTYRTLMTRAMKGCYVYCCDKGLSEYLKSRIALNKLHPDEK